jgi:hypothetical protein
LPGFGGICFDSSSFLEDRWQLTPCLQKPETLTTFGRSECNNNIYLDIKELTLAIDGQLIPAESGQDRWLFHSPPLTPNSLSSCRNLQIFLS